MKPANSHREHEHCIGEVKGQFNVPWFQSPRSKANTNSRCAVEMTDVLSSQ